MKIFHLLFLSSFAVPGLALVPGTRAPGVGLESTIISRSLEDLDVVFSKRSTPIVYDRYLPELPEGWLNTTAVEESGKIESRALATRASGDLSIRDDPDKFKKYLFLGLKVWAIAAGPVNWFSLVSSCQQFSHEVGSAIQCLFGAITQVVSIATLTYQGNVLRGQLGERLSANGWHVPGINKRDEWTTIMARDLSDGLNAEVLHLGSWEENQKRDSEPPVPREVFGVRGGGHDFHFTYMGVDAEGQGTFKLGLGNGTSINKERRGVTHNNFFFSSGGIDFKVHSAEPSNNPEWGWTWEKDQFEFEELFESVKCYLYGHVDDYDNAIAFQVYDSYYRGTLSSGIMSPFTDGEKSAIWDISMDGGIGSNSCGTFD
ncbi:hypothetical protein PISL3812_08977 [Talaromyces islandicus]|uniref:Uncharacterized protein n=1 Tax=Talaromyces islandicus TaxID=28573 RepID=A0A0U1M8H1_TALIS|nr:hypothetical protein PISL3812_08977 [Talaromyces islandicus]